MRLRHALAIALALASTPAIASAATPLTVGPGVEPAVTVDPASGTAYIAWIGAEPSTTTLHFCRLPRGAAACDVNTPVTVPGTSLTRPYVTVDGATVRIYSYRYGLSGPRFSAVYALTSLDGGATFDAGVQVGTVPFYDAIRGPGNGISLIADNRAVYQRVPDDASSMVTAEAHMGDDHPYTPSVALTANAILAVFANGSGAAQFRLHVSGGDPNDITTWSAPQDFSAVASYMRLAAGPSGTFLFSVDAAGKRVVQHFSGSGFDPPVGLGVHELTGGASDLTEDPSGRLHAVIPFGDADGAHIAYASSDDGVKWKSQTLEAGPDPLNLDIAPTEMRASVAADHLGVAVWQDSVPGARQVHAMRIGPQAVPAPAIGKTTNAAVVKGKVLVKRKGSHKFVTLGATTQVPLGSTFDTSKGTVALDTSAGAGKPLQHGEFGGGQFTPRQSRKNPLVTLSLTGGGLGKCNRRLPPGGAPKKRTRTLFSHVKGHFRSRGRNAAASARGTRWTMTDTCGGTLTIARSGTVVVRDFTLRKNKTLHSGQHYFAKGPPIVRRRGNR